MSDRCVFAPLGARLGKGEFVEIKVEKDKEDKPNTP